MGHGSFFSPVGIKNHVSFLIKIQNNNQEKLISLRMKFQLHHLWNDTLCKDFKSYRRDIRPVCCLSFFISIFSTSFNGYEETTKIH